MAEPTSNKVVLITGGAKRIGACICRTLHAQGANLMLHYRSSVAEARALQKELNMQRPNSVALMRADLLSLPSLTGLITETVSYFGQLDVLINNASSFYPTGIGEINEENWNDLIGTNLKAPLFLSQAAAGALKKTNGCIINMVDIHADRPLKNYVVYSIAKAGLAALTKSLAHELGPEVRVNAIAPGPILWPEHNHRFDELTRQRIVSHTALKKVGEPSDLAKTVKFLIYDAPYITGQIIAVDGGRSAGL